jgi:hypothetical protein
MEKFFRKRTKINVQNGFFENRILQRNVDFWFQSILQRISELVGKFASINIFYILFLKVFRNFFCYLNI